MIFQSTRRIPRASEVFFFVSLAFRLSWATWTGGKLEFYWWKTMGVVFHQPIRKICSSNYIISPNRGEYKKNLWNHHIELIWTNKPCVCFLVGWAPHSDTMFPCLFENTLSKCISSGRIPPSNTVDEKNPAPLRMPQMLVLFQYQERSLSLQSRLITSC